MPLALVDMIKRLRASPCSDTGATAVEYGLIVSLIALAVIVGVTLFGINHGASFNGLASHF